MKTFVCVGPNRGDREMVKLMYGHDRFYMFEPLPEAAKWLRDSNRHAAQWFHVVEAACGVHSGRATMNIYNTDGVSSSLGVCTEQAKERYSNVNLECQGQIGVDVVNLGDWLAKNGIDRIETLLIDAQGMDLAILGTIRHYLVDRRIKRIVHECDGEGFRHYDGLPDNSLAGSIAFFADVGGYEMVPMANRNDFNFDVEWRLAEAMFDTTQKAT